MTAPLRHGDLALPPARFLDRATPPHVATLMLIAGVAAMAQSIFLPSLAHMADDLGVSYAVMQLAVSGYLFVTAALQLVLGAAADRLGRRPVMLGALAVFAAASAGAMLAPNAAAFLGFRMLQGVVVAGIVLSRAVIRDTVDAAQSASRIGYVTMGMAMIPMVAPMLGGALDQAFGWRASFGVLTAAGLLVLALVWADQGETARAQGASLRAQVRQWPTLLGSRAFWGYSLCAAFAAGAFYALLGGAALVATRVFHLSPLATGIALGSPAIGYILGNFLSGRLSVRAGIDRMALAGCVVATLGQGASLAWTLAGHASPWAFFGFCTLLGLGNGITLPSALAGSVSVRPDLAGTASGLSGAIMTTGGALLAIVGAAVLSADTGPWPLQAVMVSSSALAGLSLLLARR